MRRVFAIIVLSLVLLSCCITAGCLSSPTDPIVGSWTSIDSQNYATVSETFNADGTGMAVVTQSDGTTSTNKFDWFNMGSVYQFIYDDGTIASTTYNKEKDVLNAPSGLIFIRQTT